VARSSYIYLLRHKIGGCVSGAWTVKYELAKYVAAERDYYERTHEVLRIWDGKGIEGQTIMAWKNIK
jgi:hypothetical protein